MRWTHIVHVMLYVPETRSAIQVHCKREPLSVLPPSHSAKKRRRKHTRYAISDTIANRHLQTTCQQRTHTHTHELSNRLCCEFSKHPHNLTVNCSGGCNGMTTLQHIRTKHTVQLYIVHTHTGPWYWIFKIGRLEKVFHSQRFMTPLVILDLLRVRMLCGDLAEPSDHIARFVGCIVYTKHKLRHQHNRSLHSYFTNKYLWECQT